MAGETSEEKKFSASAKKLRDLRKKGNIARSRDMVTAISVTVGFIYLLVIGSDFTNAFKNALSGQGLFSSDLDVTRAGAKLTSTIAYSVGPYVITLVVITFGSTLLANIVLNKGFVFTIDKIKFDLNKLNPVEGLKNLFAMRSLAELIKTLFKLAAFVPAVVLIIGVYIQAPFQVPSCGMPCFGPTLYYSIFIIILLSIAVLLLFGFFDIFLQQWLFLRDQKMTKTEVKKEQKDQEGSPETKSARRKVRNQLLQSASTQALDPTIVIEGDKVVAGMRFVRNETPLPVLVCKGGGAQASDILGEAMGSKIAIHYNDELAVQLFRRLEAGSSLPEDLFTPFIEALKTAGQI